jgi:membrane protein DedA with SNARE-associated domain
VEDLIRWFLADGHGYPFIFAALLGSGVGVPIPEDIPLIAAGVMAAAGGMGVWTASLACGVFVLIRDMFVFGLGYRYGVELLENRWASRVVRPKLVQKFQERVRKNDKVVVFTGRFMPGLRGPVFFAAGVAKVPPAKFLLIDTLAALISVPLWVWLGYAFADHFDFLIEAAVQARTGILTLTGLVALVVIVRWWRGRDAVEES